MAVLSAGAISASDVNVTDSYAAGLAEDASDVSVPLETADDSNFDNDLSEVSLSSQEVTESEDSNALSASSPDDDLLTSDDSIANLSAAGGDASSKSKTSSSIPASKTITSKDVTKYYKGSAQYSATFLDSSGKALANAKVKITVNGVTYTKTTNSKGVASLPINLKPGTYKIVAVNPKTGYSLTNTFRILSTISANDISKVQNDGRKFYATFHKSDGKALSGKNVKFKVNGKTYNAKTNSKGVASVSLKTLKAGSYKIISYNNDGLTKTNSVKVVKTTSSSLTTSSYTFLKSDSNKKISVKLLNKFGYAPSKGKEIKITINGKTYSKKTNANGVATLKLPALKKGVYTVKYKFEGNTAYKASSASNKVAIITSKTPSFTVKSSTSFPCGSASTFKVALSSDGVPLPKKTVTFTLNGNTYKKTTDNDGIASLSFNLASGKYSVTYSVAKDSSVNAKKSSSIISVKEKSSVKHNGYWVYGSDMKSVNLGDLASKGVTDVFLNFKAYELYGKSGLEKWISTANSKGIKVHMWVQTFYQNSVWTNPVKNGQENTQFFNQKISEIKKYAAIKGLSGIHLDYLRYPEKAYKTEGGTKAITSFAKQAIAAINSVNYKLIVSASLMPETSTATHDYGQDYAALSKMFDVVVPMAYKGNYGKDSSWITSTAKWYVSNSKGASVWIGIQTFVSENDETKLSASALSTDINAGFSGGAKGVMLFRYGFANSINFNSLTPSSSLGSSSSSISVKNVIAGAKNLKTYIENNKKLPNTVTIAGITFTTPEFLYLMSQAIVQLGSSNTKDIAIIKGIAAPSNPSGDAINADLSKDGYLTVAKNLVNFIKTNKRAPNFASSAVGNIIYSEVVDAFSRILAFYPTESRLPSKCTITYNTGSTSSTSGKGLNEANTIKDLTPYLKSTTNCQVNSDAIKNVVKSVTKGLSSKLAKAKAIFNYVRDTLSYSFYYDTQYGATGTLSAKKGNCVDHSHLLVAMFRTAGLPARYVHGTCKFTSGSTYGHVWTQVMVDGKWHVADATSSKNTLGSIANWNTKSFTLNSIYISLPF
jgi:hypothetical protein